MVLEGRDNAKFPTAAAHAPEEVGVRGSAGGPELTVGRHDIDGYEVIGSQAILASQPADPATQGESRNAGIGACAPGGGQTERLGLVVEVHPLGPPFSTDGAPTGVDTHTTHLGQIDEPPIAHRGARDVVATATDRHQEMVGVGELTAWITSATPAQRAMSAGLRSIMPFQTVRASS